MKKIGLCIYFTFLLTIHLFAQAIYIDDSNNSDLEEIDVQDIYDGIDPAGLVVVDYTPIGYEGISTDKYMHAGIRYVFHSYSNKNQIGNKETDH